MVKNKLSRLLLLGFLLIAFCIASASCAAPAQEPFHENTARFVAASDQSDSIVSYGSVNNVVIFICFADENPTDVRSSVPSDLTNRFNGSDNSIKDYYNDLSYGAFSITSVFPAYNDGSFFVYRDSQTRSYYTSNNYASGPKRTKPESDLLNNAVYEASIYFDFSGLDLDVNDDGFIDCVTFLVSGDAREKDWNRIMWPHSWNLHDITREAYSTSSASLNGKRVGEYTFFFIESISSKIGQICHEIGHAVGDLPDLYHYNESPQRLPVGYWDLMHLDCKTPQFMTTYLRWKYLSFVDDNQIVEMEKSGDYTLTPTTVTGRDQTLAYKLTVDNGTSSPNESIWIEYRRNDVTTYDKDLPGSGLIVYRINTNAEEGNKNGRYHSTAYPDEVFFYRPEVSVLSGLSERDKENLSYAYISLSNPRFSSLGNETISGAYDPNCIYLTDGSNTGIVITVLSESPEQVTFHVDLGAYDSSEIDEEASYVMGNTGNKKEVVVYYGDDIKSQLNLYIKRRNRGLYRANEDNIVLLGGDDLYDVCEEGKDAYIEYTDEYGTYVFPYRLTIYDQLESKSATVVSLPTKLDYTTGEAFLPNGLTIQAEYSSGKKTIVYLDEEAENWSFIGFDAEKSGVQDITAVYKDDVRVHFTVEVHSDLVSLRVDEKNTRHIRGDTVQPRFNVVATYKDGMEKALESTEFIVESEGEYEYAKTNVTIRSKANENVTCVTYVYNVPHRVSSVALVADPKRQYRYGEALDLSGGKIQISFGEYSLDGDNALPLENYYSAFSGYSPTGVGKQSLRLNLEDATLVMDVEVLPLPGNLLSVQNGGLRIKEDSSMIILEQDHTLNDLAEKLGSYLNVDYTYTVGKDVYTVLPETYGALSVQNDIKIVLSNSEGVIIKRYSVFRSGDGNNDGKVDDKDIIYWKRGIINKETNAKADLFDKNGDNKYTLTDYVILTDELYKEGK